LTEVLKQGQYVPMDIEKQVIIIFATINGFLDDIEIEKVKDFEKGLLEHVEKKYQDVLEKIAKEKDITDEGKLKEIIEEFKEKFVN